jgi:hypothetical protein
LMFLYFPEKKVDVGPDSISGLDER